MHIQTRPWHAYLLIIAFSVTTAYADPTKKVRVWIIGDCPTSISNEIVVVVKGDETAPIHAQKDKNNPPGKLSWSGPWKPGKDDKLDATKTRGSLRRMRDVGGR